MCRKRVVRKIRDVPKILAVRKSLDLCGIAVPPIGLGTTIGKAMPVLRAAHLKAGSVILTGRRSEERKSEEPIAHTTRPIRHAAPVPSHPLVASPRTPSMAANRRRATHRNVHRTRLLQRPIARSEPPHPRAAWFARSPHPPIRRCVSRSG